MEGACKNQRVSTITAFFGDGGMMRYGAIWQAGKGQEVVVQQEKGLVRALRREKAKEKMRKIRPP